MSLFSDPPTEPALAAAPDFTLPSRSCEVCSSKENLLTSNWNLITCNCQVTYYCSRKRECLVKTLPNIFSQQIKLLIPFSLRG